MELDRAKLKNAADILDMIHLSYLSGAPSDTLRDRAKSGADYLFELIKQIDNDSAEYDHLMEILTPPASDAPTPWTVPS